MTICKDKKELIFSSVITAVSGLLMLQSFRYPPESSGFPRFLTILMLCFSLMLLVRSVKIYQASAKNRSSEGETKEGGEQPLMKKLSIPLVIFASTGAYAVAIQHIGYFVSTTLFFLGTMTYFGRHRLWVSFLASLAFMLVIYALFIKFLGLRMPEGLLF